MAASPNAHATRPPKGMPASFQAQFAKNRDRAPGAEHFYDFMLESCERLFENDLEQQVFEDQMRYMFGVKVGR